jgi:hypothetical protein
MSASSLVKNAMAARGYYQGNVAAAEEARKKASGKLSAASQRERLQDVRNAKKTQQTYYARMINELKAGVEKGGLVKRDAEEFLEYKFGKRLEDAAADEGMDEGALVAQLWKDAELAAQKAADEGEDEGEGALVAQRWKRAGLEGGGRRSKARRSRKAHKSKARRSKARRSKARRSKARGSKARGSKARRSKARRSKARRSRRRR